MINCLLCWLHSGVHFEKWKKTTRAPSGTARELACLAAEDVRRSAEEPVKMTDKIYNDLLKELDKKYPHTFSDDFYIYSANTKYQKKFNNAIKEYATLDYSEKPVVLYDGTVFGSATDGFLITTKGLWLHNYTEDAYFWSWKKMTSLTLQDGRIFINGIKFDKIHSKEETNLLYNLIGTLRDRLSKYN